MFSPRELTAVITVLTETRDTNHSTRRLMRVREREHVFGWGVMDGWMYVWMDGENIKGDEKKKRGCGAVLRGM